MSRYLEYYRKIYNENYKSYELVVNHYSKSDRFIESYNGTFKDICKKIAVLDQPGYFRFAGLRQETIMGEVSYKCFNTSGRAKGGLSFDIDELMNRYLNRAIDDYIAGTRNAGFINEAYDFYHFIFVYAFLESFVERLLSNDDSVLDDIIDNLKKRYKKISVVTDLDMYANKTGIYILILRKYKCCYVGQATDIRKRIKEHWSALRGFDIKGIDTFKVGDTSEILFYECAESKLDEMEQKIIWNIPIQYTLNWNEGGKMEIRDDIFFPYKDANFEDILIADLNRAKELLPGVVKKFYGEN